MTLPNKDRKYKYTEHGLKRLKGKKRRKANPHKFCNCINCKKLGHYHNKKSRKKLYREEARANNRRLRKGFNIKPIGYTD